MIKYLLRPNTYKFGRGEWYTIESMQIGTNMMIELLIKACSQHQNLPLHSAHTTNFNLPGLVGCEVKTV